MITYPWEVGWISSRGMAMAPILVYRLPGSHHRPQGPHVAPTPMGRWVPLGGLSIPLFAVQCATPGEPTRGVSRTGGVHIGTEQLLCLFFNNNTFFRLFHFLILTLNDFCCIYIIFVLFIISRIFSHHISTIWMHGTQIRALLDHTLWFNSWRIIVTKGVDYGS